MALLELREASYSSRGATVVGPVTLTLEHGAKLAYVCENGLAACALAMMAAALVKPASGTIFVEAFDSRIQPVQIRRIAGYVPHEAPAHDFASLSRYVEYRAALWGLPRNESVVRARALIAKLDGVHEQFAFPLAGALLFGPRLLVLDRPQAAYAQQIARAAEGCAIFSTHTNERDAQCFAETCMVTA